MIPEDISSARGLNVLLGFLVLIFATLPLAPGVTILLHEGLASVYDWPLVIYGLTALGLMIVGFALRLMVSRQKAGVDVAFNATGFDMSVRQYLRRPKFYRLAWTDIETMRLNEAPRGANFLAFRLTLDAAVREGIAKSSTRENGSRFFVRREVVLPLGLCNVPIDEVISRFFRSADASGAALEEVSSFNILVIVRKVWRVLQA